MPMLPLCDPENSLVAFGSVTSAALLCDIGLTASVLALVVSQRDRSCCQEVLGAPVVRWFVTYILTIGGALATGRLTPMLQHRVSHVFTDSMLLLLLFGAVAGAGLKMGWQRQHWALIPWVRTLAVVALGFFMGCLMISQAIQGWTIDCNDQQELLVPCLPESFYIAACAGVAACMMGAVVGIVFFTAADEVVFNSENTDFLMMVVTLVVVAITLSGFEYSSAKVYGSGVSDSGPAAKDVSAIGMVGTLFQCAGLIGGGSYATAGVMATTASIGVTERHRGADIPQVRRGDVGAAPVGADGTMLGSVVNGPVSGRGVRGVGSFGCSLANCMGRVAVASSAWCAGGVVVLSASHRGPSCGAAIAALSDRAGVAENITVVGFVGKLPEVDDTWVDWVDAVSTIDHKLRKRPLLTNGRQESISRPWVTHAAVAFTQLWAPALIGVILLGTAGQALTIAACRQHRPLGRLIDSAGAAEIELVEIAAAENWRPAEPMVENAVDEGS